MRLLQAIPRPAVIFLLLALAGSQIFFLLNNRFPQALDQPGNTPNEPGEPLKSLPLLTPEKRASLPSLRHRRHWEARPGSPVPLKPLHEAGPEGELWVYSPLNLTKLEVNLMGLKNLHNCLHFRFFHSGIQVAEWSPLMVGFMASGLGEERLRRANREGEILQPLCEVKISRKTLVGGEAQEMTDLRVRLDLTLTRKGPNPSQIQVTFVIFDEGVAIKLKMPLESVKETQDASRSSADSLLMAATFHLASEARMTPPLGDRLLPGPVIAELNNGLTVAITEARNLNHMALRFQELSPTELLAWFEIDTKHPPKGQPVASPWFLILVGRSAVDVLNSRNLALHLNPGNELADVSWVIPGKMISSKRLSTEAAFQVVELLDLINGQYVLLDSGWYGDEDNPALSPTNWDPKASKYHLHIPEIVKHGKSVGVGVILYVNDVTLHRELDQILSLFTSWGVAGIKIGRTELINSHDTSRILHTVRRCAEHRLVVIIADNYTPSGISRTLPNLLSAGSIRPTPSNALILPFQNLLTGLWIQDWRDSPTLQVAFPIVMSSGLPHLFQTRYPEDIMKLLNNPRFPQFEICKLMPAVWKETHVLDGIIGEYLVVARKAPSGSWFVAAIGHPKVPGVVVDLEFLETEGPYTGTRYREDPSSAIGEGSTESFSLSRHSALEFHLTHGNAEIFYISPA